MVLLTTADIELASGRENSQERDYIFMAAYNINVGVSEVDLDLLRNTVTQSQLSDDMFILLWEFHP